jgi:hypothetical protein
MPSRRSTRDDSVIPGAKLQGAAFVLDPELEVRDGTILASEDKEIPIAVQTWFKFWCRAKLVDDADKVAVVFTRHWVKWLVRNDTKTARTVAIIFTDADGAPLKPCTIQASVPAGQTVPIQCDVADVEWKKYSYEIWCQ